HPPRRTRIPASRSASHCDRIFASPSPFPFLIETAAPTSPPPPLRELWDAWRLAMFINPGGFLREQIPFHSFPTSRENPSIGRKRHSRREKIHHMAISPVGARATSAAVGDLGRRPATGYAMQRSAQIQGDWWQRLLPRRGPASRRRQERRGSSGNSDKIAGLAWQDRRGRHQGGPLPAQNSRTPSSKGANRRVMRSCT